jgi:hypothetical protein
VHHHIQLIMPSFESSVNMKACHRLAKGKKMDAYTLGVKTQIRSISSSQGQTDVTK